MNKIIGFIQRERLYILILVFVLLFNLAAILHGESKSKQKVVPGPTSVLSAEEAKAKKFEESLVRRQEMEKALHKNKEALILFSLAAILILGLILLGLVIDAIIFSSKLAGKNLDVHTRIPGPVRWGLLDVGKVVLLLLFFAYLLILSEVFLSRLFPILKVDNFRMIVNTSLLDIIAAALILYFTIDRHKERLAALGLSTKDFFKNVFYGIVGYIALIPILIALLIITAVVINIIKYVPERQPVVELFLKEKDIAFLAYSSLFAAIIGPIIEELFFRGFMYGALKKYLGVLWAMIMTAAVFAALHTQIVGFLPIMALGILLAYIYEKTGTLVSSITAHIIHNLSMVFLIFLIKQVGYG
ncbi:MAG: hypothetical protein A3C51_00310 [Omnitrophica bacterium RIFCSPHIGHO2_02_FULL_46_20]|nr:MAG: hypothetical protein A3C51_00310 [Omnitrophica bacterium RIFCSPHIGHO2_02_FULL_46_20]